MVRNVAVGEYRSGRKQLVNEKGMLVSDLEYITRYMILEKCTRGFAQITTNSTCKTVILNATGTTSRYFPYNPSC